MSDHIIIAIEAYQACTTAEFVKAALDAIKDRDYAPLITADSVRLSAAVTLRDAIDEGIARLNGETREPSESAIRKRASRMGYSVSKSRAKDIHSNNAGQFMLCDAGNTVVLGDRFDASLHDIADFLSSAAAL